MDESYVESGIRKRLIEAGLRELLEHGSRDFSLRRVALAAQVSCAAPYRHFKDKDELVRAVIAQIREDWILLSSEISHAFAPGSAEHVTELVTACVRFWIADDNFAAFLSIGELAEFDLPIISAVLEYARANGLSEGEKDILTNSMLALTYGTVTIIMSRRLDADSAIANLKKQTKSLLL